MKFVFEFSFDDMTTDRRELPLTCTEAEFDVIFDRIYEDGWITNHPKGDLECTYGIHDVSGTTGELGFDTYEVPKEKVDELWQIWVDKFTAEGIV